MGGYKNGHGPCGGGEFRRLIGGGKTRPVAILFRQLATPNYELRSFLNTCARLNFEAVILTYRQDRMSCHNTYKRSLIVPMFVEKINRQGQPVWRKRPIANVEKVDRQRLCDIDIVGRTLPDIHSDFLKLALGGYEFRIVDGSSWFGKYRQGAREYYIDLFLGLRNNFILFEDFPVDGPEKRFVTEIVEPAFENAKQISGTSPNLMRLTVGKHSNSPLWYSYPDHYRKYLSALKVNL